MSNDQDIKAYFERLKQDDEDLIVPDFHLQIASQGGRRRKRSVLTGIAASLILLLALSIAFFQTSENEEVQKEYLSNPESNELLSTDNQLENWESKTDYLLEDFKKHIYNEANSHTLSIY